MVHLLIGLCQSGRAESPLAVRLQAQIESIAGEQIESPGYPALPEEKLELAYPLHDIALLPDDPQVTLAYGIAAEAHSGQWYGGDADRVPYIDHPVAVALEALADGGDAEQIAAALLHDVVEDTPLTAFDLRRRGVSEGAVRLVADFLTRREGPGGQKERYHADFIARIATEPRAARIKRADLRVNMRKPHPEAKQGLRQRYERALAMLDAAAPSSERALP